MPMKIPPQDMTLKYDGRVLRFEVFVNTAEDASEVLMRIQKAARGQGRAAVLAMASIYTGDDGANVWKALQSMAVEAAANPKSIAVDEDGKL